MPTGACMVNCFLLQRVCVRPRRAVKDEAAAAAGSLVDIAVRKSYTDPQLALKQAELARKLMLRYNVRFDYSLRRFICHGCKKLVVPGVNARVRLGHGKQTTLRITCLNCGRVNRKILKQP